MPMDSIPIRFTRCRPLCSFVPFVSFNLNIIAFSVGFCLFVCLFLAYNAIFISLILLGWQRATHITRLQLVLMPMHLQGKQARCIQLIDVLVAAKLSHPLFVNWNWHISFARLHFSCFQATTIALTSTEHAISVFCRSLIYFRLVITYALLCLA